MQHSQCEVAGGSIVYLNAETVNIQHLRERQGFGLHFLVDAIQMFFASLHLGVDVLLFQALAD